MGCRVDQDKERTVLYMHRECVRRGKTMDTICRRDIKLSDYNISRAKYNELKYFAFSTLKEAEAQNAYGLKATVNDGMPKSNLSGDSTAQEAVEML